MMNKFLGKRNFNNVQNYTVGYYKKKKTNKESTNLPLSMTAEDFSSSFSLFLFLGEFVCDSTNLPSSHCAKLSCVLQPSER